MTDETFLYFAYGSNMYSKRIHIKNPSAIRVGIGKLEGYRLDFLTFVKSWQGAPATIVKTPGHHVWGAIWTLDKKHMESLDRQEGVSVQFYIPFNVEVEIAEGSKKLCRTYKQSQDPPFIENVKNLPENRLPSKIYLDVIKQGAKESKFPEYYLKFLNSIPDNGNIGSRELQERLGFRYNN